MIARAGQADDQTIDKLVVADVLDVDDVLDPRPPLRLRYSPCLWSRARAAKRSIAIPRKWKIFR